MTLLSSDWTNAFLRLFLFKDVLLTVDIKMECPFMRVWPVKAPLNIYFCTSFTVGFFLLFKEINTLKWKKPICSANMTNITQMCFDPFHGTKVNHISRLMTPQLTRLSHSSGMWQWPVLKAWKEKMVPFGSTTFWNRKYHTF